MKRRYAVVIFLLFAIKAHSQSGTADTIIAGVSIRFSYSPAIFPASWQVNPVKGQGEAIAAGETGRSKKIVLKALDKYPDALLKKNLKAIYFLRSMKFYNVGYGGTNSTDALYLTNDGAAMGYSDLYLEQTLHHEFSSILYRNYFSRMDTAGWNKANPEGFDYTDPESGVGAIRKNKSSQDLDTILCERGFLTQYALSGMENDINTVAQNLFSPSAGFWKTTDQFPRIREKVMLLIRFYNSINAEFTEQYFRNMVLK